MNLPLDKPVMEGVCKEMEKCKQSPYYFATTYLKIDGRPFTTAFSEEQFNQVFHLKNRKLRKR